MKGGGNITFFVFQEGFIKQKGVQPNPFHRIKALGAYLLKNALISSTLSVRSQVKSAISRPKCP